MPLDVMTRKLLTMHGEFHPNSRLCKELKEGGQGFINVSPQSRMRRNRGEHVIYVTMEADGNIRKEQKKTETYQGLKEQLEQMW